MKSVRISKSFDKSSVIVIITALAGGNWHSLALKNDGTGWAWGDNWTVQLGVNINSKLPVQVA
jgi:alpha-tubulin suppressor-like RCC1 family protein